MGTNIWLDAKASIILLPSGQQGKDIIQLAENWAEVGLLGPALWVQPELVSAQDDAPPIIQATVIGVLPDKSLVKIDVDLFEQLAREDLDVIRLIKVRSATPSREADDVQDNIVKIIDDYMNFAMPAPDRKMSNLEARSALDVITLICATTEFKAQKRLTQHQRGSGVTILAAPEDRSSPWSTDAFVRDGDRFGGFMLMHMATVAGIWNGLPVGTMELAEANKPSGSGVWISRVFFSGVLTDGLARRVAADILESAAKPTHSLESAPAGTAYIEDEVLDEYVQWMVSYMMTLDDAILTFKQPDVPEAPGQANIGIWSQISHFFGFAGQRFVQIPFWIWRFIKGGFSKKVQEKLQGEGGLATVNLDLQREKLDRRDKMILDMFTRIKEMQALANISMQAPVSLAQVRSTPALWSKIRDLVFGTLDGGSGRADSGFPLVGDEVRPIFRTVSHVLTHPDSVWKFPDGVKLPDGIPSSFSWNNLEKAAETQEILHQWVLDSNNRLHTANTTLFETRESLKASEQKLEELDAVLRTNGALITAASGGEKPITLAQAAQLSKTFALKDSADDVTEVNPESAFKAPEDEVVELPVDNSAEDAAEDLPTEESSDQAEEKIVEQTSEVETSEEKVSEKENVALEEVSVQEATSEPGLDIVAMLRERKSLVQEIKDLYALLTASQEESLRLTAAVDDNAELEAEFIDWLHSVERSLIWKLKKSTQEQRSVAQTEVKDLEKQAEELVLDEPNRLIKYRKAFHKSLLWTWGLIAAISGIIAYIINSNGVRTWMVSNQTNPDSVLLYLLIGIFVALIFAYLIAAIVYYRNWSKYERHIQAHFVQLESLAARHINARKELARLTVIHRQTMEWLDLLARILYKPWSVRPSWLESGLKVLNTGVLPFSMRVAQANDEDQASRAILKTRASNKLGVIGWRENAFNNFVKEVARVNGRNDEAFSIDVLDKDLPHASNGSRELLRNNLENQEVLENVALAYLRPIIADLQMNAMATARPTVLQVDDNPLEPLRADLEGIENNLKEEKWNDFLRHTLTRGDGKPDPVTPLSALAINEAQVMAANHEDVFSYALLPEHVLEKLGTQALDNLEARTYDAKHVRPLDAVVRVDIAGPLQESEIRVWAASEVDTPLTQRGVLEDTAVYESF